MAAETKVTIITYKNFNRAIENMQKTFAPKSIENDVIKTEVSKEQPVDQNVGDLWFIEQERN